MSQLEDEDKKDILPMLLKHHSKTPENGVLRKRSEIWMYFSSLSNEKAECQLCHSEFSYKNGSTSNLRKHLTSIHPHVITTPPLKKPAPVITTNEVANVSIPALVPISHPIEQKSLNHSIPTNCNKLLQSKIDSLLMNMIVQDLHPFSVVEGAGFKELINYFEPNYELPNSTTILQTHLPQMYNEIEEKVKHIVNNATTVNISAHCWTSLGNKNYLAVTGHFLSNDFQHRSFMLEIVEVNKNQVVQNLLQKLQNMVTNWKLSEKIFSIATDNSANLLCAIKNFGWTHIHCFSNILNIVAKDALDHLHIKDVIIKLKKIIDYFHASSIAYVKFLKIQSQLTNLPGVKLINDVPSEWNTTFYMIERCLEVKEALCTTVGQLNDSIILPSEKEWSILNECIEILRPLEQVMNEINVDKYICISKVIPLVKGMRRFLTKFTAVDDNSDDFRKCLLNNLNQRFKDIESEELYSVATFLDPRYKKKAFSSEEHYQLAKYHVKVQLGCVVEELLIFVSPMPTDDSTKPNARPDLVWDEFDNDDEDNLRTREADLELELKQFIEESNIPRNSDPLEWWRSRVVVYPHLSQLASKYLGVLATSVANDKVFSRSGQILNDQRWNLNNKYLNMLVFLNYNIDIKALV